MATSPTSGPGGGGSGLPSQWSADSHGNVVAETDQAVGTALTITGIPTQLGDLILIQSDDGTKGLQVTGDGAGDIDAIQMQTGNGGTIFLADATGDLSVAGDPVLTLSGGTRVLVSSSESVWQGATAAPPDGHLGAGEFALWLDPTNGVGNTKLMVKAKSADGTVKTATIVLA